MHILVPQNWIAACYMAKPRYLYSWRDDPPVPPPETHEDFPSLQMAYEDYTYLDSLCERLCALPSIAGLLQAVPGIQLTNLYWGYAEDVSYGGMYQHGADDIDLNASAVISEGCTLDHMMLAHLAHEIRHGAQERHENHSAYWDEGNFTLNFTHNRIVEADATVFSIVVAYEYAQKWNDDGLLEAISGFDRDPCVDAYLQAVTRDAQAHDNGSAAHAAFRAYFSKTNFKILDQYDVDFCDEFQFKAKWNKASKLIEPNVLDQEFFKWLEVVPKLPYLENGILKERPLYMPQWPIDPALALAHFGREARDIIKASRRGLVSFDL